LERVVQPEELNGRQLRTETEGPPDKSDKLTSYAIGLDIGARHDRTALAVLELRYRGDEGHFLVRYLKRLRLGILFRDVATQVKRLVEELRKEGTKDGGRVDLTILTDATGGGAPVAEMITKALPSEDVRTVFITGGNTARFAGSDIFLSKGLLVSNLVALFESNRIYLSKDSKALGALVDELANFEIKVSEETGNESYSAKTGRYDDLVTALGLASWWGEYSRPVLLW
jgi:hypothetical protein